VAATGAQMQGWNHATPERVDVLHVDDDEGMLEVTATHLEGLDDRFRVRTAVGARAGLDVLAAESVDCVVSDYQMPGMDGLEFLAAVRERHPDLPFVLFTDEGSEVASDAIAAGATDYVTKGTGTDRYEVLANRVSNAVERYDARRGLERSAERFRGLAAAAPVPIGVVGSDGLVRYVNDAAVSFLGVDDAGEVRGREATAFVHPDDRERAGAGIQRVLTAAASPSPAETRFLTPDGDVKTGIATAAPIEYDGEPASQVVVDDVTAERQARDELERQEGFTGSLLSALDDLFFVFEVGEGLVEWNDRVPAVTGYDDDALAGMSPLAFVPADDRERAREAIDAVDDGESVRYDGAIETGDDEVVEYELNLTGYEADGSRYRVGIGQDISERMARERSLRERKDQLETIVRNFPLVAFVIDEDRTFTRSVGSGLRSLDLEPGELVGLSVYETYGEYDAVVENVERAFDGTAGQTTMEIEDVVFETRFEPVFEDGEVTQVVGASIDITDRVQQREELEAKNGRLEEFASVVSHDLRNPLGVARGAFERVASSADDDVAGDVERVQSAHERMDRIVDDVLALARGDDAIEKRAVDGGAVAHEAVGNVATGGVAVDVTYEGTVYADRGSLARLVENLVRNAVEHGGPNVVVSGLDDDPGFYVADDGPGIPESARAAMEDPDASMHADGIGLGLGIVKDVADAHDWTVTVTEDEALGGACVEVRDVRPA